MSITVRTWTDDELWAITRGEDDWLATVLLNCKTLDERMHRHYPYGRRKTYWWWSKARKARGVPASEVEFYATDDEMAARFLHAEYNDVEGGTLFRVELHKV